jgi:hypothetical protein
VGTRAPAYPHSAVVVNPFITQLVLCRLATFLRAFFGARGVDEALALAGVLSLTVILRALARALTLTAIGPQALDFRCLRARNSATSRTTLLGQSHVGHEQQSDGRG